MMTSNNKKTHLQWLFILFQCSVKLNETKRAFFKEVYKVGSLNEICKIKCI